MLAGRSTLPQADSAIATVNVTIVIPGFSRNPPSIGPSIGSLCATVDPGTSLG